jgi:hypothetical protein
MLYNKDLLLLHFPKTAGKSVAVYFTRNVAKPVHGIVSPGQVREIALGPNDGVYLEVEGSHDNYQDAEHKLSDRGIDIERFKALLLPVRNPYDLVVSNYYFLRQSYERNEAVRERPNFAMAARSTFAEFCAQTKLANFEKFLPPVDAHNAPPIELIHFETLKASLSRVLTKYGITERHPLPHLNKSKRPYSLREMYDVTSKRHIDEKMDAMFRIGGYPKTL